MGISFTIPEGPIADKLEELQDVEVLQEDSRKRIEGYLFIIVSSFNVHKLGVV